MNTDWSATILDGIAVRGRRKFPVLVIHHQNLTEISVLMDTVMRAGGEITDMGRLKKFPSVRQSALTTIGITKTQVVINKGNGTCWDFTWTKDGEIDEDWKQACYDTGGVLLVFTHGPDANFLDKAASSMVNLEDVMTLCSAVEFPRKDW